MKNENEEVLKSPFDLYFDSCEEEFIIKLYEVPEVPGRKTSKQWIQDFENEKPSEEFIAAMYGAGHYWVMGMDKAGKIKSKDIRISDRAVQRIHQAKGTPPPMANNNINNMAGNSGPQSLDGFVSLLEKLMTGVITPLISAQNKPASPVAQLEEFSNQMMQMFQRNMQMINTQMMNFTQKIAKEHLQAGPAKVETQEESAPSWIREIIGGVKPYIDSFLEAQGIKAEMMKENLRKEPVLNSILDDDEKLNLFFTGLAEDPDIGEKKAIEVFQKFGFTPIYDNDPETDGGHPEQMNNNAAPKTA